MSVSAWTPVARRVDDAADAPPAQTLPPYVLAELVAVARELQAEEIDLDNLLALVAAKAAELVQTELAWIALFDGSTDGVHIRSTYGARDPEFSRMQVPLGLGLGGVALGEQTTLVIADYAAYAHDTPEFVRATMVREGVCSVICAPMLRGSTMVGALYVANRSPTRFGDEHASLVSTLAAQASVAIQNGSLYRTLLDKTALLEATFEMHRQLGEAAAADIGVDGVTRAIAELTGRELVLEQTIVEPFVRRAGRAEPPEAGTAEETTEVVPIVVGGDEVGRLSVCGAAVLTPLAENALTHGATVLALELMRHRAAHEVEWQLRDDLLQALLEPRGELSSSAALRARRFGVDLDEPHRLVVLEPLRVQDADALRERVRRVARGHTGIVTTRRGEQLIVLVGASAADTRSLLDEIAQVTACRAGVSAPHRTLPSALREASACLAFARVATDETSVVSFEQLGGLRFMLDVESPTHAAAVARETLGALAEHDVRKGGQLVETLRAYLELGGFHAAIAARCHIHPSTVKHRLGRIAQVLDVTLADSATRFDLMLAFRIVDLFASVGVDVMRDARPTADPAPA